MAKILNECIIRWDLHLIKVPKIEWSSKIKYQKLNVPSFNGQQQERKEKPKNSSKKSID